MRNDLFLKSDVAKNLYDAVRGMFYFAKGTGCVNGKVCVSAEFSFALVKA